MTTAMQPTPPPNRSLVDRILLTPEEPRLRPGWRIVVHSALLMLFMLLASPLLIPLIGAGPQAFLIVGQAVTFIAINLSTWIARRWIDKRSFDSLGLVWDRQALKDLGFGFLLPGFTMGLVFLVEWAFGWLQVEGWRFETDSPLAVTGGLGLMFLVFVVVGWQEELLSRGYWLQNLAEGLRLPWAVIVSSVWFALAHLGNPNVSLMAILGLTAAGLYLAYGYLATRQLWLPIGLHIGWNFFEGPIFGFPVSGGMQFFNLVELSRSGPELLTGGAFGPEAGLIQVPALLLGVWAIHRYSQGRKSSTT